MLLIDLAIIYLTCGTPFAVFCAAGDASLRARRLASGLAALGLWPLLLLRGTVNLSLPGRDTRTENAIARMEAAFRRSASVRDHCEFRETLARYVSLSTTGRSASSHSELLRVASHPAPAIARACIERRRQILVAKHLGSARDDLLALLTTSNDISLIRDAIELGTALRDDSMLGELRSLVRERDAQALSAAAA